MAVKVSKPKVNLRQKLTELDIPKGVHGTQVLESQTAGETFELVKAGRKNLLLNGEMRINQRGDVTGVTGNQYGGPDRWKTMLASCGTWGISQSTDVPIGQGFKKSLRLDCEASRATLAAGSALSIAQYIEGQDLAHLGWGYPKAKDLTLSFWLKTDNNVTGTFVVLVRNHGGGTILNRQVRVRDTSGYWNKYVVNIPADKANQFTYDNSKQLEVAFHFDAGSNLGGGASGGAMLNEWIAYHAAYTAVGCDLRLADSTGNNLYITGVQLEEGSEPTPYQHLTYGEELALCQRYTYRLGGLSKQYQVVGNGFMGQNGSTKVAKVLIDLPVTMRTNPSVSVIGTDAFWAHTGGAATDMTCHATSNTGGVWNDASSGNQIWLDFGRSAGGSPDNGTATVVYTKDTNQGEILLSAEL